MTQPIRTQFLSGITHGVPFILILVPFALLFGVVGTEAGLNLTEVMGFSVLVIAGSAQFTAIQLMVEDAPTVVILATALAVNLRMAMYSASMVAHLGAAPLWQRALASYAMLDQTYALSIKRFDEMPSLTGPQKMAYFTGAAVTMVPPWYLFTYIGAVAGTAIPPEFALDFALPITFLALVAPLLRTLPHVVAALTSVAGTLALIWVPFSLGLILAAIAALLAGTLTEIWLERRRVRLA